MKCPRMYYERYEAPNNALQSLPSDASSTSRSVQLPVLVDVARQPASSGIEPIARSRDGLDFGTRFHWLADASRRKLLLLPVPSSSPCFGEQLDSECDSTFAAYEQHYLGDPTAFIESERTHTLPLPQTQHKLAVKLDAVCRFSDGTIGPFDTKTESKPGYNFREDWAGRTQASLYLWALTQLYPGERVSRLVVDVVTRGSARRGPSFSRIDDIARTQSELEDAVRNVIWVCQDVEASRASGWWRSNMNICKQGWMRCDYYDLHVYGRSEKTLALYKPAEAYLDV